MLGVPFTTEASEICFWTLRSTTERGVTGTLTILGRKGSHWNFEDSPTLESSEYRYSSLSLSRERVALEQSVFHGRMKHVSEMLFA